MNQLSCQKGPPAITYPTIEPIDSNFKLPGTLVLNESDENDDIWNNFNNNQNIYKPLPQIYDPNQFNFNNNWFNTFGK